MEGKQEQEEESAGRDCVFHALFNHKVVVLSNGDCPLCLKAPSDEEQLESHGYADDDDEGCWP